MKNIYVLILSIFYLSLVAFVIWASENALWALMVFMTPSIVSVFNDSDDDDDNNFNSTTQLNG